MSISFILRMLSSAVTGKSKAQPETINGEIERAKKRATKRMNRAKVRAQDELGELDRVRIRLMSGDMKKFAQEFSHIKNVDFKDCEELTGLEKFNSERRNWKELEKLSAKAMSVFTLAGAMDVIGLGVGVLEQYATLPEVEGLKVDAGVDDVEAYEKVSGRLEKFQEEVANKCKRMQEIRREARMAEDDLLDLADYFEDGITDMQNIRIACGNDWKKYTSSQKTLIGRTAQIARLIRSLSEVRFLTDDAEVRPAIKESMDAAEELLDELGA